jgi:hypothetical protein
MASSKWDKAMGSHNLINQLINQWDYAVELSS